MTSPTALDVPPPPETVRLSGPSALIGAVPILLGFHPARSLVMVCVHGLRQQVGPALRIDLPVPSEVPAVASFLATQASRHATAVLLLWYSPDADDWARGRAVLPHHTMAHACLREMSDAGIPVLDAVLVRAGRAWSYLHHTARDPGRELVDDDPGLTHLRTAHVGAGRAVLTDRTEVARTVAGPGAGESEESTAAVLAGFDRWAGLITELDHRGTVEVGCHLAHESLVAAVGAHVVGRAADAVVTGWWADLIAAITVDLVRDAVLSWCLERVGETPVAMFVDIARWVADEFAVPVLTVLALLAYRTGDGALANVALERALAIDPEYRLAVLTAEFLTRGVHPTELDSLIIDWADHPANPRAPFWYRLDQQLDADLDQAPGQGRRDSDQSGSGA